MRLRKRYTSVGQGQKLLARLVKAIAAPEANTKETRRIFQALLQSRTSDVVPAESSLDDLRRADDADVLGWQKNLRQLLQASMFLRNASKARELPRFSLTDVTLEARIDGVEIKASPVQMLMLQTFSLIRLVGIERIHVCTCGRPFVRVGKRQFCSERCQKRVYMKRFRAGEVGRVEE